MNSSQNSMDRMVDGSIRNSDCYYKEDEKYVLYNMSYA